MATIGDNFQPLAPDFTMAGGEFRILRAVALSAPGVMDAVMNTKTGHDQQFNPDTDWVVFATTPESLDDPPYAGNALLNEDFTGTTLPASLIVPANTPAPTVTGGLLHCGPGANARWVTEQPFQNITATAYGAKGTAATYARLRVRDSSNTSNYAILAFPGATTGNVNEYLSPFAVETDPYTPASHAHQRIREQGGQTYFEVAADPAGPWTVLRQAATPAWGVNICQFDVHGYGGTGEATFDRFEIKAAS